MRTKSYIVTAVDADADGVAAPQAPVAGTALTLGGTTTFGTPRFLTLTATDDFSAVTFTIVGQDRWGNRITEDLAGPDNETVQSTGDYLTVLSVTPNVGGPAAVTATGVLTGTTIAALDTVTIGAKTYTFVAAVIVANDVKVGASDSDSLDNLIAAINGAAGVGALYGTGTVAHTQVTAAAGVGDTMNVTAITAGAAGNSIATTSSLTAGGFAQVTLTGGDDADPITVGWPAGGVSPWVICGMKMGIDQVSTARVSVKASEGTPAGNVELTFDMFPQLTGPEVGVDKTTAFVLGTPQDAQAQGVRVVLTSGVGTSALVKVTRPGA